MMTSAGAALRSRVVFNNSMICDVVASAPNGPGLASSPRYAQVSRVTIDYAMTLDHRGEPDRRPRAALPPVGCGRGQVPRRVAPRFFEKATNGWKDGDPPFLTCVV